MEQHFSDASAPVKAPEEKQSAFVIVYTRDLALWRNHTEKPDSIRDLRAPAILMINRSDYTMGFPGGGLKNGETPLEGALQELREELNLDTVEPDDLRLLLSQQFINSRGAHCTTHCFTLELSADEFKQTIFNARNAQHFMAETRGVIPVSMEHSAPTKPLPFENFLKSPMADSVRAELCHFISQEQLLPERDIKRLIANGLLIKHEAQPEPEQRPAPLQA